ncbi:OLC1v1015211C1 [Oldenlandia corymbosa var. corymbosa]|uniref:OLC1v1015211C1 n=1 Tax=Oldenlandia corymbosa var. corymbosa TaxID=529605 RepID=A0AAV1E2X0_OLDCO|nr:OLC1v1015211C1 [Oldenlandia corymbosa var. corymbosa]
MSAAVLDAVNHLLGLVPVPETLEKFMVIEDPRGGGHHQNAAEGGGNRGGVGGGGIGSIPVDILDSPKEYIFYMDVPGLSKSDIQVTVEEENTLVIKSNGKRKREEVEEEGCKYLRLERRPPRNLLRKFRLPENCNVSAITAKCENGVLTVVVEKHPPPPKSKTVEVKIS